MLRSFCSVAARQRHVRSAIGSAAPRDACSVTLLMTPGHSLRQPAMPRCPSHMHGGLPSPFRVASDRTPFRASSTTLRLRGSRR